MLENKKGEKVVTRFYADFKNTISFQLKLGWPSLPKFDDMDVPADNQDTTVYPGYVGYYFQIYT